MERAGDVEYRPLVTMPTFVRRHGDVLLAAGIVALAQLEFWTADGLTREQTLTLAVVSLAVGVLYAFRVRFPLGVGVAMLGLALLEAYLPEARGGEWIGNFVLLGVYTVAAHTSGWRAVVAAALTLASGLAVATSESDPFELGSILFFAFLFGTPWAVGRAIRRRRLREAELEREKAEAEAAIAEERTRIARELHDVVAHAISVIVLQARGGRKLLESEPAETRQALDAIERTASQALGEMRRLLGLLRESDAELALSPQPTLARLDDLLARVGEAGLPVELAIEGQPAELPPGVDLSAYRIVQEALTNALKHAGPATARVTVRYGAGELDVEVSDDGAGSGNGSGGGQGLAGIRERVAVFGGDVVAGSQPEGGWTVRARLPFSAAR
jgi:signal transduction histidine kinase